MWRRQVGRERGGGAGGGGEAGVVCAAVACVCGVGCALSMCRTRPPPPLPPDRVSSTAQRDRQVSPALSTLHRRTPETARSIA